MRHSGTTPWSAAILAGGRSRRFGPLKFLEKVGSRTLIGRVAATLNPPTGDLMVVLSEERDDAVEQAILTQLRQRPVRIIHDVPGQRSIAAGIEAALLCAREDRVLIVAADMPFVSPSLWGLLTGLSQGHDVTVPFYRGFYEPAAAVYSKKMLNRISHYRKSPQGPLWKVFHEGGVTLCAVDEETIGTAGDPDMLFFNINTGEDLERARALVRDSEGRPGGVIQ